MKPGVGSTSSDLRPPFESIGVLCVLRLAFLAVEGRFLKGRLAVQAVPLAFISSESARNVSHAWSFQWMDSVEGFRLGRRRFQAVWAPTSRDC